MDRRHDDPYPRQTLRLRDGVAIVVGIVLGAGIFRTPSLVAQGSASGEIMLLLWVSGAAIALIGALCYAELAAAYPDAGGDYHFLGRAFGSRLAFLYGWARLAVIQTGSIAVLAYVFGDYIAVIVPLGPQGPAIWAAIAVVAVTAVNWAGVQAGAGAQRWLTLVEVAGLAMVIVAGLFLAPGVDAAALPAPDPTLSIGLAMVFVLLTFGGWNEAAYVSAELRGGGRRVVPVLFISLGILTALYLLANLAYLRALGLGGIGRSQAVAADVMGAAFGPSGAGLIAVAVAIAALTSANATAITGARGAYALGRDIPALGRLGAWHAASGSPRNALAVQGLAALALVGAGVFARDGFQLAVEYTAPVFWGFFLLSGIALFVLRRRDPARERPFRVPLYPVVPLLFCAANAYLLWSSLAYTGWGALVGVGVVAAGALLLPFLTPRPPQPEIEP
ncbi:APC family permease [Sphingomonas sp.]|uniref:APC family permease n=1 Tax=Sphingomonas sp. TaxID=28214 RepID=UPI002DD69C4E|nr:APC family permease [Sphingomonas sp.]